MSRGLATVAVGDGELTFEYLDEAEAEFLHQEIFVRKSYEDHGVSLPTKGRPVVIDLGANLGLFSLRAHLANPNARIIAVEPSPAAFAVLERNLSATPARCLQQAVRDRPGVATLTCFADAPGESSCNPRERQLQRARLRAASPRGALGADDLGADAAGEAVRVEAVTLSALMERLQLRRIDLLKIDVEGDEYRALLGLTAADFKRVRQVVVEVHDAHGRLKRVVDLLRRHGFSVVARRQAGGDVAGYRMVVPRALELHIVFAVRRPPKLRGARR